jgi:regulator of extracellular matrix RemA (YlzA/DUF370 family)
MIMDSGHVILSPLLPETIAARIEQGRETEGLNA